MRYPLAVFAPDIGAPFTRRHMCGLLPGGTVVVASTSNPSAVPVDWSLDCPLLDLSSVIGGRLRWQVAHGVAKQFGVRLDRVQVGRFLKRHQVRVILAEYLDFSLQWLEIARDLGIPFFPHAHGDDVLVLGNEPRWQTQYLRYRDAGGIICNSEAVRDGLLRMGLSPSKLAVAYCGVDVPAEPVARNEQETIRCVAVGRVVHEKAPILLLDAFRRAAQECPTLTLDYVGDGPLFPAVHEFTAAFNLGQRIHLHGSQPHGITLGIIRQSDIFVQHSIREGLGISVLEGMAHSLPVVATRVGGILETVVDGSTGYLTDPGDSVAMAEHIVALARDPNLRRRMGLAGWRRAKEHFTWEKERADLLRILGLEACAGARQPTLPAAR